MQSDSWQNDEKTRERAAGLSLTHHNAALYIIFLMGSFP